MSPAQPIRPESVIDDDGFWTASVDVPAVDSSPVEVLTERTEDVDDPQRAAALMTRCLTCVGDALPVALAGILADMQSIRQEDWAAEVYGEFLDELLPELDDPADVRALLTEPSICCHADPNDPTAVGLGFGFDAPWDPEHGTAGVVSVRNPGTPDQRVELWDAGGSLQTYSPFD